MLRIDIHTHAFHPRIAARAVASLERTYGLRCQASGLLADLERQEQAAGIDRYALLCAATSASQVVPANNYAIEVHGSDAGCGVAFGTLHPGFATDVLSTEPPAEDNPLLAAPNAVITPHIAWASVQSRQRIISMVGENIRRWMEGTPVNVVNKPARQA